MKITDKDPWKHFAEAFQHFDRGWNSADAGFRAIPNEAIGQRRIHTITASSWGSRLRMVCLFLKLALKLLFCGRVTIKL